MSLQSSYFLYLFVGLSVSFYTPADSSWSSLIDGFLLSICSLSSPTNIYDLNLLSFYPSSPFSALLLSKSPLITIRNHETLFLI